MTILESQYSDKTNDIKPENDCLVSSSGLGSTPLRWDGKSEAHRHPSAPGGDPAPTCCLQKHCNGLAG